jgi:hypothetical protein
VDYIWCEKKRKMQLVEASGEICEMSRYDITYARLPIMPENLVHHQQNMVLYNRAKNKMSFKSCKSNSFSRLLTCLFSHIVY